MAINVFTASGRLGNDLDIRYTPNNKCIGSFSLPVESGWGDNKKTAWVSCKLFGDRAEKLAQYLTKGSQVTVTGNFQLDEWEKDGVKHSRPVIIVNDIQLPPQQQGNNNQQPQQPQNQPQYSEPPVDYDDRIPFAPIGLQYGRNLLHVI